MSDRTWILTEVVDVVCRRCMWRRRRRRRRRKVDDLILFDVGAPRRAKTVARRARRGKLKKF